MSGKYYSHTIGGPPLPEKELDRIWQATQIVQQARDQLDPKPIIDLLSPDAVYEAQNVEQPLIGKVAIADYLQKRFEFFQNAKISGRDIGKLIPGIVDLANGKNHPCLIFEADASRQAVWVISVNSQQMISRIDILTVAPHPSEATPIQA